VDGARGRTHRLRVVMLNTRTARLRRLTPRTVCQAGLMWKSARLVMDHRIQAGTPDRSRRPASKRKGRGGWKDASWSRCQVWRPKAKETRSREREGFKGSDFLKIRTSIGGRRDGQGAMDQAVMMVNRRSRDASGNGFRQSLCRRRWGCF